LVGELSVKSNDFVRAWARHGVHEQMYGTKRMRHPLVGELTLLYETLALPDEPEQYLVTYTAQDTESQMALDLLASIAAQHRSASAHEPDDNRASAKTRSVSDTLPWSAATGRRELIPDVQHGCGRLGRALLRRRVHTAGASARARAAIAEHLVWHQGADVEQPPTGSA
jgi:hypothetical protein